MDIVLQGIKNQGTNWWTIMTLVKHEGCQVPYLDLSISGKQLGSCPSSNFWSKPETVSFCLLKFMTSSRKNENTAAAGNGLKTLAWCKPAGFFTVINVRAKPQQPDYLLFQQVGDWHFIKGANNSCKIVTFKLDLKPGKEVHNYKLVSSWME